MDSIFANKNRAWDSYLYDLTPVQKVGELFFKREDFFAPYGYGNINGSKLRQCIWLISNYFKSGQGGAVISAASIHSPQLPMATAVAKHYGLDAIHIIGSTNPEAAIKKTMVNMATEFGAKFKIVSLGFNLNIQRKATNLIKERENNDYYLNYGITVDNPEDDQHVFDFHEIGANQVKNVPDHIENIIIPAGSCNSLVSILLGIYLYRPASLKNIFMIGIGPNKSRMIKKRLLSISKVLGDDGINHFFKSDFLGFSNQSGLNIFYVNLHDIGYTKYSKKKKFTYESIKFHPRYEGKVISWFHENFNDILYNHNTLFWIVGSEPDFISNCKQIKLYES